MQGCSHRFQIELILCVIASRLVLFCVLRKEFDGISFGISACFACKYSRGVVKAARSAAEDHLTGWDRYMLWVEALLGSSPKWCGWGGTDFRLILNSLFGGLMRFSIRVGCERLLQEVCDVYDSLEGFDDLSFLEASRYFYIRCL